MLCTYTTAATLHTQLHLIMFMFDALTHLAFPFHPLRIDDFNHVHRNLVESGNLFLKGSTRILCQLWITNSEVISLHSAYLEHIDAVYDLSNKYHKINQYMYMKILTMIQL